MKRISSFSLSQKKIILVIKYTLRMHFLIIFKMIVNINNGCKVMLQLGVTAGFAKATKGFISCLLTASQLPRLEKGIRVNIRRVLPSLENTGRGISESGCLYRSSHRRYSVKNGILKNFSNFTGKYLCLSFF